jgi:DNA-directed RNA polymerase subunit D
MVSIELLNSDKEKKKISFLIKGITPSLANSIRRCAIEEVPTMAIEDVEFRNNSSALYDEIIAHRLGLIPLKTDLKSYNLPDKCKCGGKGCAQCQLKLTLKTRSQGTVYASEIKSKDPKVKPVYPNTQIVKLLKGQKLEFEATAILGKGKDHAKWCPGLVYYKKMPVVEIKKECKNPEAVVEQCPQDLFEMKNGKLSFKKNEIDKCHMCNACADICDPKQSITVESSDNDLIFYVESWGQLEPNEIIDEALKILIEKSKEFTDEMNNAPEAK